MRDEELLEQAQSLQLIYCDGFGAFRKVNGLLRCVGFVIQGGAMLNLAVSLSGADQAQVETRRALSESDLKISTPWNERELTH